MQQVPERADVVVIGGGAIGLCVAYALLRRGRAVTVLEQATLGAGSSWGNAGLIVPSHIVPLAAPGVPRQALAWLARGQSPFAIMPTLDWTLLPWLYRFWAACSPRAAERAVPLLSALGQASAQLFTQLIAEEKLACDYAQTGLLSVYRSPESMAEARHEAALLQRYGMPVRLLDADAARDLEPALRGPLAGAALFEHDAHLNPACFVQELGRRVRELGATICEQTSVMGFSSSDGAVAVVHTNRGSIQPAEVVLAAGVWSRPLAHDLGLALPVRPARGYSLTMALPKDGPQRPLMLAERKIAVTPMGPLLRCTGRLELSAIDARVAPRQIAALQEAVSEALDLGPAPQLLETWAGLRPTTPDGLPIIGRAPGYRNLILATGHAMLGVSLSPITGQLVAQLMGGERPAIALDPFSAARFA